MSARGFLLLALAGVILAAGCIQPDQAPASRQPPGSTPAAEGSMGADEKRSDASTVCVADLNLGVGGSNNGAFCAVRTITVTGSIASIPALPVNLRSFNGAVKVHESSEGSWGFVATITARGATPDEATGHLSDVWLSWSHVEDGVHALSVQAKVNDTSGGQGLRADLDVTLPPSVVMDLAMTTGAGSLAVEGGRTDGLSLSTGSGSIAARTLVTDATLHSGSGSVDATLRPTSSGAIEASTGSGSVTLGLPEDASHGYDLTASTGSGAIDVGLKDGKTSECPSSQYYTPSCNHRAFQTSGYAGRSIQTTVALSSGSGDLTVRSA